MEYVNLAIGVVALVVALMAVPTIFQMLFGRPHLAFEADDFTGDHGRVLVISIKNEPVKNKLLRGMGVEREVGEVLGFFDIQERGTNKITHANIRALMQCAPLRESGICMKAMPGYTTGLVVINMEGGVAGVVDARLEAQTIVIEPGEYIAHIGITRGQRSYAISQAFRVSKIDHETIWNSRHVVSKQR